MKTTIRFISFVLFYFILCLSVYSQSDKEKALQLGNKAVELEDEGKFDEALKLLDEALKLDPGNSDILYEKAYSYYGLKQYDKTKNILEKLMQKGKPHELYYDLLGNAYDMSGETDKAVEIYKAGLKDYPNSGRLYLELCVAENNRMNFEQALIYCEKGISVDPKYPSNYYWASKYYCNSSEKVWGLIYGEIFMNLERGGKRTEEISELLYKTYKRAITIESDTNISVKLSKKANILFIGKKEEESKFPFEFIYEFVTTISVVSEKTIDINSIDRIRTRFLEMYFKMGHDKKYPNILFDFQKEIQNSGNLETYNHWIVMKGNEEEFGKWYNDNLDKWDKFMKWFTKNQLKVNKDKKFHREQYQ